MSIPRYRTIGAVVPTPEALHSLERRLGEAGIGSLVVLAHRRDLRLIQVALPALRVLAVESGFSRRQWIEFGSMYFTCTTVDAGVAPVNLWTAIGLQLLVTLGSVFWLVRYHRRSRLREKVLGMGLPAEFAADWAQELAAGGFALALVTVPEERFEEAEEAFLEEEVRSPLAVDRRLVL